jgi:hypothetical protein
MDSAYREILRSFLRKPALAIPAITALLYLFAMRFFAGYVLPFDLSSAHFQMGLERLVSFSWEAIKVAILVMFLYVALQHYLLDRRWKFILLYALWACPWIIIAVQLSKLSGDYGYGLDKSVLITAAGWLLPPLVSRVIILRYVRISAINSTPLNEQFLRFGLWITTLIACYAAGELAFNLGKLSAFSKIEASANADAYANKLTGVISENEDEYAESFRSTMLYNSNQVMITDGKSFLRREVVDGCSKFVYYVDSGSAPYVLRTLQDFMKRVREDVKASANTRRELVAIEKLFREKKYDEAKAGLDKLLKNVSAK